MTSLLTIECVSHIPALSAVSYHNDTKFTFCQECEQNVESFYIDFGGDRLNQWSEWEVSK